MKLFYVQIIFLFAIFLAASPGYSCSTVMLSRDDCLLVGHNLDQSFYTPGIIHVNLRSEKKRSVSGFDLNLTETKTPILEWTSKYGSVTFSPLGRNLPDGGMNEAGLTVSEMGLGESVYPFTDSLSTMIGHLWIQYQLDNYATVEEVLAHLKDINIEPISTFSPPASANYHLFITDIGGNVAIIEFIDGEAQVYVNESVPVPALCNLKYQEELERLETYQGIGGWLRRYFDSGKDIRFIKCAEGIEEFETSTDTKPVDYCFDLLAQLQFEKTKQWSIVYDIKHRRIYFRTAGTPGIRYFDFESLDFSADAAPVVFKDMDADLSGDISGKFVAFTTDADRFVVDRFLRSLVRFVAKNDDAEKMDNHMYENYGIHLEDYIDRALKINELILYKSE